MQPQEVDALAAALGSTVVETRILAGGFSHETCLLTLTEGQVVARLGGPDPAIEAAVMSAARRLMSVDEHKRLVHADLNPKNILVSPTRTGWRVDAVLDWEFSYSGCPYGDAANMARFGADYPSRFWTVFGRPSPLISPVMLRSLRIGDIWGGCWTCSR